MRRTGLLIALLPFALAACEGDSVGPDEGEATVAIRFATTGPTATAATASLAGQQELRIAGDNGVLVLTDIVFIVSEFELEAVDGACLNEIGDDEDDCEEFEAQPFLLDLPLVPGQALSIVADQVPLGTYTELEFEVEDLDFDDEEDDPATVQALQAIRQQITAAFPGVTIPEDASLFVRGRFEPTEGEPRTFLTLFDAEIEVEQEFVPPLVITEDGATRVVTVTLDPARLFTVAGRVLDLSRFDFATTGELVELEAEFEQGFELEIDD